jgi:hypothetical protein
MKKEKSLETLLVLTGVFVLLFWIYNKKIFLLLALLLILIGIVSPYLTGKISWLWLKFSEIIGNVMSKIILSVIFFVFLIPLALISRIFRKDNLSLKKKETSYYSNRNHLYSGKDLENIW